MNSLNKIDHLRIQFRCFKLHFFLNAQPRNENLKRILILQPEKPINLLFDNDYGFLVEIMFPFGDP